MCDLIKKYNVPGPRYTSYPTVPHWQQTVPSTSDWERNVKSTFKATNSTKGISIYIHLPYCESLCSYCGCHKKITKNHSVESPYIRALLKEWLLYKKMLKGQKPVIAEIHLGGGTPTFFSPYNLKLLISTILEGCIKHENYEFSFEGHPNNTTALHLETLYKLGFRRVSFGIQDFDENVQTVINRIQPYDKVKEVTEIARKIGYRSINFDLIYGLPKQTKESIALTFKLVNQLAPERIAFYSYAHVPWAHKAQRLYTQDDIPVGETKRSLYEYGKQLLEDAGYKEIGMDHFAKPNDDLYIAFENGLLHRNFMGYTTNATQLMIGLGASSISDAHGAYIQNHKQIESYLRSIESGNLPVLKGHLLSEEDKLVRKHINGLMCGLKTTFDDNNRILEMINLEQLEEMENEGLLAILSKGIVVTNKGKAFIRNICMNFDQYLKRNKDNKKVFSQVI